MNEQFFSYNSATAALCMDHIHIGQEIIPLSQVDKIKILPESAHNQHYKIKVSHFGTNKFIASSINSL